MMNIEIVMQIGVDIPPAHHYSSMPLVAASVVVAVAVAFAVAVGSANTCIRPQPDMYHYVRQ